MSECKVLLIDDEVEFTKMLGKRLAARGFNVETASSGKEALDKVEGHDFDVALLDLAMPGWDGVETLQKLKESKSELQIILLTGHATVPSSVEVMRLGAMDVLEKPADFDHILEVIEEASNKKALLVEDKIAKNIEKLLQKKGW
jgi:DNA-binding NtrC family response regulator